MKKQSTIKSGFTFIEVLVVATIIAVMATIGVVSYSSANIKARDGKRKADIEQIRAGLEMYRVDNSTTGYPNVTYANLGTPLTTYLNPLPNDPKCPAGVCATGFVNYSYTRNSTTTYTLCACKLEVTGTETDYCVYNP